MVLWLIGISGAGKTTVGRLVVERLRAAGRSVIFIDGDEIREVWSDNLGHTLEDRRRNHTRLSKLCSLLDQDGIDVVVSALSIFPDLRRWNRETFRSYVEVHIDTPIEVVSKRDPKKIYERRMQTGDGFVVGIDMEFPVGTSDLTISGSESTGSPEVICEKIIDFLNQNPLEAYYPYSGRDLFDKPEFYEYADCRADNFLDGWRRQRQDSIRRLGNVAPYPLDSIWRTSKNSKNNHSTLKDGAHLTQIMEYLIFCVGDVRAENDLTMPAGFLEDLQNKLYVFLKKFEIFRRLHKVYDGRLNAVKCHGLAEFDEYFIFGVALIVYNDLYREPRFASALLKLIDAMLSRWVEGADHEKAEKLVALIQAEAKIVEGWLDHVGQYQK